MTESGDRPTPTRRHQDRSPDPEPGSSAAGGGSRPSGWAGIIYDVVVSVLAVALVGLFLFTVSGVWPPLVAVESGSMVPNMEKGDLVFVMEEDRFPGPGAVENTGVVTANRGTATEYYAFEQPGDVIVYAPGGNEARTPIIHRAMFWVEQGENWYERAADRYVEATSCDEMQYCPAPHAGFITKGDANGNYDQAGVGPLTAPVRPDWVVGTAEFRIPGLGWIRLSSG